MSLDALFTLSREFLTDKQRPYRRYFLNNNNLSERCNILLGQRGVGKTTIIVQSLLDYVDNDLSSDKILYIQADHFLVGQTPLYEIAEQFQMLGGEYLALDEIHKYAEWSMELKSIIDSFPHLKILASGSSALEVLKGSHDLSRRVLVYKISGMSLREYIELRHGLQLEAFTLENILESHTKISHEIIQNLKQHQLKIIPLFHEYLRSGYYPYSLELNDIAKFKMLLEQNIHTTLESDLMAIHQNLNAVSVKKIKQLMIFIAQSVPFKPNWAKLKKLLDFGDERTLKKYFDYLEKAELITPLYKPTKLMEAIDHPAKVYLQNPNLAYAIAEQSVNVGTVREIFFNSLLSHQHHLTLPINGDFLVDNEYVFEIGGRKKSHEQVKDSQRSFVVRDDVEMGYGDKIPLWLFGFIF